MLATEPENIPLEDCKGIGSVKAARIRAILRANRKDPPTKLDPMLIPPQREYELFVDYEFFNNVNVDFDAQWPTLEGCEMVFMIGLGWIDNSKWQYKEFMTEDESHYAELNMVNDFIQDLEKVTEGEYANPDKSVIYHWTSAEVWQTRHIYERHQLPLDHPTRRLPWHDLQKPFLEGHLCIPGAWDFTLKESAKALGLLNKEYDPNWPEGLGEGLEAAVVAWRSYAKGDPLHSEEAKLLKQYLHADCRALFNILNWVRLQNV
ncbi:MAG: ribonuclease H-like domain-containing protein [Candidatus Heimdallarchaeota archaeon]|nr:ribonuclease H-like domain-containing protein [Candidatus Heimdallarchaeota archaeon]